MADFNHGFILCAEKQSLSSSLGPNREQSYADASHAAASECKSEWQACYDPGSALYQLSGVQLLAHMKKTLQEAAGVMICLLTSKYYYLSNLHVLIQRFWNNINIFPIYTTCIQTPSNILTHWSGWAATASRTFLTFSASAVKGLELLYQPEVLRLYLSLLTCSHNNNTLEAAAGAVQNLAAGHWAVSGWNSDTRLIHS